MKKIKIIKYGIIASLVIISLFTIGSNFIQVLGATDCTNIDEKNVRY